MLFNSCHDIAEILLQVVLNTITPGIMVAIFKMATGRNFSMSEINSGHHNLPTYEMSLKSDNVEFYSFCR
jgi:hypothetical protein